MQEAQLWCEALPSADWLGAVYQSGNRIAHLYFLLKKLQTPAWLVNLYFTDDPIAPTSREQWAEEIVHVKVQLGLNRPVQNLVEVFLPAVES